MNTNNASAANHSDPRDYFRFTAFQKRAGEIDPDPSHDWKRVDRCDFLCQDDEGTIAGGETFNGDEPPEKQWGILLAEKTKDGKGTSAHIHLAEQRQAGYVLSSLARVSPLLQADKRHTLLRTMIAELPSLQKSDSPVITIATATLNLLDDLPSQPPHNEKDFVFFVEEPEKKDRANALSSLVTLAVKKMPADIFRIKMKELRDSLQFIDDPFGANFESLCAGVLDWVLDTRADTRLRPDVIDKITPHIYTIADKTRIKIESIGVLRDILQSLPIEPMPDIRMRKREVPIAEMVRIDRIVGGTEMKGWTVSTSEGRGPEKIFEFANALRDGMASIAGRDLPIRIVEVDGKYFVEADGRHRVAALKALGVYEAPMMVVHLKKRGVGTPSPLPPSTQ